MNTTLVQLHDCIKDGNMVQIKASVVDSTHGKIVNLIAHSDTCKEVKGKTPK